MQIRAEEITEIIKSKVKNFEAELDVAETGVVLNVGDGIARIHGLEKCTYIFIFFPLKKVPPSIWYDS